jgi:hypothetical protein
MKEEDALDFYKRITEGKKNYETISLEHSSGAVLEGVEMHPVDKRTLAGVIENLPQEMFEGAEEVDDTEEAEERLREDTESLDAISEDTIDAFEDLCTNSLRHPDYTNTQVSNIVEELNFEMLFELGTAVIELSSESTGTIQGFQKQG